MERPARDRWQWRNNLLVVASEVLTCATVGGLMLRDAFGARFSLIDAVAGAAVIIGGLLLAASELGSPARQRRRMVWAWWFLGGGFVVFAGHLL